MNHSSRTTCIFLALALLLLSGCKDEADNPSGAEEKAAGVVITDESQDLTKLPHEAVNNLILTAEVLDQEKWIVGLTWKNVGDADLTLPMAGFLKEDIREGYTNPFYPPAYSKAGIVLSKGKHSDKTVLDFDRDDFCGGYETLREIWGSGGYFRQSLNYSEVDQSMRLRSGEKVTCFFRYPKFKHDDQAGLWKDGDKIPIDFSYFVDEDVAGGKRVSLKSDEKGQAMENRPPSLWRGKVFSNVVYLEWSSGGERVRCPAHPYNEMPPEPVNDLLLFLEILDEEKWIVKLTWKNVGTTPIEVPITEALQNDMEKNYEYKSPPLLCTPGYYTNYHHHGRAFGCKLGWGQYADEKLFDLNRDGKHRSSVDAYEALLKLEGQFVGGHRLGGLDAGVVWKHIKPGGEMSIRFWFPRFESDYRFERWRERGKIPLEFCFKAGEIPYKNSLPPEREERISDDEIRFRSYPAWQGEVYSNTVFFTWTSDGPRVDWSGGKRHTEKEKNTNEK